MATGSPFGSLRNGMEAEPEIRIRIRENRILSGNFFFAFFASTDPLGPQKHSPEVPVPPNPDPDREIRIFRFFDFLSLKTLQYGCLWTPLDQLKSPVPVLRYLTVLNGT